MAIGIFAWNLALPNIGSPHCAGQMITPKRRRVDEMCVTQHNTKSSDVVADEIVLFG